MGPEHFWSSGMWIIPLLCIIVFAFILRGGPPWMRGGPWRDEAPDNRPGTSDAPLDVLKMRFAKGEISREEFEEMRQAL